MRFHISLHEGVEKVEKVVANGSLLRINLISNIKKTTRTRGLSLHSLYNKVFKSGDTFRLMAEDCTILKTAHKYFHRLFLNPT